MKTSFFRFVTVILLSVALYQTTVFAGELPEVLLKHRDAVGTVEAIESLISLHIDAQVSMLIMEGTAKTVSVVPDNSWTYVEMPVVEFTEASNGLIRWKLDQNRQLTVRDDTFRLNQYAPVLQQFQYLFPNEQILVTDEGVQMVDDIEYHVIKVDAPGMNEPAKMFLDPETWLCVRMEGETDGIPVTVYYSDFRDVNGVQLPHKEIHRIQIPGMPESVMTTTDIRVNEPVNPSLFEPPASDMDDMIFPETGFVTVPMKTHGEHLVIELSLNDNEPVSFLLDSGAATTIMDCAYADKLGLERTAGMHALGVGGVEPIDRVTIDSLSVGEFAVSSLNVFCMNLDIISEMLGKKGVLKGIVGYDLFARAVLRLDYAGETLTLYNPDTFDYDGSGTVVPGNVINNLLYIDGVIDGAIEGKLRLDTGAAGGLHLHAGYIRNQGYFDRYEGYADIEMAGAGGSSIIQLIRVQSVSIGDFTVRNPVSTMNMSGETKSLMDTLDAAATVGNQVFSQFVVFFDLPNSRLILEHADKYGRLALDRAGMKVVERDDGRIVVASVQLETPSHDAGFKAGDRIVQVEKLRPGNGLTAETLNRMLAGMDHMRYRFRVERDGQIRRIRLTLE
jgi:hypothetical protein